jgi:hypothetical protein
MGGAFTLAALFCALGPFSAAAQTAGATLKESTYDWKTWDVAERADHGASGQNLGRQVTRHYKTLVLENEYLAVTLLPDYGARILSIFNKATGHEELFQNPVGFADGIGAGSFYYNWLMVLGGIFPTFPEPEHGKTYLLPWKSEVVANGPDKVSVSMSLTDDINFAGHPGKFNLGVTGLTCITTVTLQKGRSAVEMKVQLRNDKSQSVRYEYWTCHSLAPGSAPGDTKAPMSTEIVVPIEKYSVGYGTGGIDRAVAGGQEYKNLAFYKNWKAEGIAYAEPAVTKKWWGVLNHDNEEGLFRIVDDPKQTPGLKFWTWGWRNSYPLASRERQFIELWAGAGHQFFSPVTIAANTTRAWTETYIPTAGLKAVSLANENALVSVLTDKAAYDGNTDKTLTLSADIVSATPGTPLRVVVNGGADGSRVLLDSLIAPDPKQASRVRLTRPLGQVGPGKQTLTLKLLDPQGTALLEAGAPVTVTNVVLAALPRDSRAMRSRAGFALTSAPEGGYSVRAPDAGAMRLGLYDIRSRLIFSADLSGATQYHIPYRAGSPVAAARMAGGSGTRWVGLEAAP